MRITAEQKATTRQRILDVAAKLFRTRGYDATTTRDIAVAAEIAAGTLFNYFPTKEAIVSSLVDAVLVRAGSVQTEMMADGLEEELFARVAAELRHMKPHRKYISAMLETSLSPLSAPVCRDSSETLRTQHLEMVAALARRHGLGELSPVALQLYWTLYTGLLAFWAADKSPKQEDTLALLDQSLAMFALWLRSESD